LPLNGNAPFRPYDEAEQWTVIKMKKRYASGEIDTEEFDRKKKEVARCFMWVAS